MEKRLSRSRRPARPHLVMVGSTPEARKQRAPSAGRIAVGGNEPPRAPGLRGVCRQQDAPHDNSACLSGLLGSRNSAAVPLEGLEHVLSIVLCDTERQIPRNYAAICDRNDIDPRPKTAIGKQDVGKTWAKMGRSAALSEASGGDPHLSAFESKFQHGYIEHIAQLLTTSCPVSLRRVLSTAGPSIWGVGRSGTGRAGGS